MRDAHGRIISRPAHPFGLLIVFLLAVLVSAHLRNTATGFKDSHEFLEREGQSSGQQSTALLVSAAQHSPGGWVGAPRG